ncbi:mitochondrial import inner membrane translocase subunit Tim10 B [Heptranchias perlo]|uniref:mitochondrial import inner membrane translocase subunit Tim10 B n=1 Tax=Heptranchias perlo TaxID=212740 RepID=UPI00355A5FB7
MAAAEPQGQLRNLRDFLLVYNKMTESCFNKCVTNLNYRTVTMDEESCVNSCAGKLIRTNHRLMDAYVQLMPTIVQKRISDYESKAAEVAQKSLEELPAGTKGPSDAPDGMTGTPENPVIIDPPSQTVTGSSDRS